MCGAAGKGGASDAGENSWPLRAAEVGAGAVCVLDVHSVHSVFGDGNGRGEPVVAFTVEDSEGGAEAVAGGDQGGIGSGWLGY